MLRCPGMAPSDLPKFSRYLTDETHSLSRGRGMLLHSRPSDSPTFPGPEILGPSLFNPRWFRAASLSPFSNQGSVLRRCSSAKQWTPNLLLKGEVCNTIEHSSSPALCRKLCGRWRTEPCSTDQSVYNPSTHWASAVARSSP